MEWGNDGDEWGDDGDGLNDPIDLRTELFSETNDRDDDDSKDEATRRNVFPVFADWTSLVDFFLATTIIFKIAMACHRKPPIVNM